jgi:hypothetical protein
MYVVAHLVKLSLSRVARRKNSFALFPFNEASALCCHFFISKFARCEKVKKGRGTLRVIIFT